MKYVGFLSLLRPFLLQRTVAQNSFDDIALYKAAALRPNATRSVSLTGVNMTNKPLDGVEPEGWTAAINITEVSRTGDADGQPVSSSVASFDSHGAFVANSSWDARDAIVRGWKDDGDCVATFGQKCECDWVRAISQARASALNHSASSSVCGDMIIPSIPSSCQGLFMVATISHSTFLASHLRIWV